MLRGQCAQETLEFVRRAHGAGVQRFIFTGTYAEYGLAGLRYERIPANAPLEPNGPYASSKAAASIALAALCRELKVRMAYFRLFSVFGEGQFAKNFWPQLREAANKGQDFPMTPGEQIRDFIDVESVARRLLQACVADALEDGKVHVANLASGEPVTLRNFAELWWHAWKAPGTLLFGALPYREDEVMRYIPEVENEAPSGVNEEKS
jgi:nucleoside-diphosphate-sugar epimerase